MDTTNYRQMIDDFENHYQYDSTYMRELLETSQQGFARFNDFLPLARHQEKLEPDAYWVVKTAAMQAEDCGECLQLNVRMALEAGVAKPVIQAALKGGEALSDDLKDVYDYARQAASNTNIEAELMERISSRYDKGQLLEFGLCIATAKVFPTIKRATGQIKSCSLIEIEV